MSDSTNIINIRYDSEQDVLYVGLSNAPIEESVEVSPDLVIDLDENGNVVGVEMLNASKTQGISRSIQFGVAQVPQVQQVLIDRELAFTK